MLWFDLDNSPHVPLFRPVFSELDRREVPYLVTARKYAQTEALLDLWKIEHKLIGVHGGKSKVKKIINLWRRSLQLKKFIRAAFGTRGQAPLLYRKGRGQDTLLYRKGRGQDTLLNENNILAVSHGSRTQVVAAYSLGIKSVVMLDYEYTETKIFNRLATYLLMPAIIPSERLASAGFNLKKVIRYNGFKEELYLASFVPDANFRSSLGIGEDEILVVVRPPGMSGSYHDRRSEELFIAAVKHVSGIRNTLCLIVNRTDAERNLVLRNVKLKENVRFLEKPVDGLQLLYAADLAISGGGTMNRESALLGTKTYSILTARHPYMDEYLAEQGKLTFIESIGQITRIPLERVRSKALPDFDNNLSSSVTEMLLELNK